MEKLLLKEYAHCGADAFILDNFISRERSGSTGQRIPAETVAGLLDILGMDRVFLAGGMDEQGVRDLCSNMPLRGVDIDTGARIHSRIDGQLVMGIVSAARARVN
jgi:phosphoribosylanthranilate isomerase